MWVEGTCKMSTPDDDDDDNADDHDDDDDEDLFNNLHFIVFIFLVNTDEKCLLFQVCKKHW